MRTAHTLRHAFPFLAFALAMATFYPGHLSFDSAVQYWSARTGEFYNVSPPLQPVLWSVIQSFWPESGGLFALQMTLFIGGIWIACSALFALTWQRVASATYLMVGTPAMLVVTHLWTDALMIACLVAGSALLLAAGRWRSRPLLFATLPFFLMGGMARYNALPALVPLFIWWGVVRARVVGEHRPQRASILFVGALAGSLAVAGAAKLLDQMVVKHRVSTFTVVQVFDIAGISVGVGEILFPAFMLPPGFTMDELRARYVPYNNVPLFQGGIRETLWEGALTDKQLAELRRSWANAVRLHPVAYLRHRFAVTRWLFGRFRNDRPQPLAFVEGIASFKGNPVILPNGTALHRWAMTWYERSIGWWGFAPITYIVIAVGIVIMTCRARPAPARDAALALAASGLVYIAPLPWVVPSAELRYSGWLFAASSLALIAALVRAPTPATRP